MGIEPGFLVHAWSWQRSTLFFAALHSKIHDGYQQILMQGVQGKGRFISNSIQDGVMGSRASGAHRASTGRASGVH